MRNDSIIAFRTREQLRKYVGIFSLQSKVHRWKMECLAKIWDGSEGKVSDGLGYTLCMAIVCENGCRRIVPPMLRLWLSVHSEFASENDEVCQVIDQHLHFGDGSLPIGEIVSRLPSDARISIETKRDFADNLDDFVRDAALL